MRFNYSALIRDTTRDKKIVALGVALVLLVAGAALYFATPKSCFNDNYVQSGDYVYWSDSQIDYQARLEDSGPDQLHDADPQVFCAINATYARDDRGVFFGARRIPEADPASFRVIADSFAKDAHAVYWGVEMLPGGEPRTFKSLGDSYGKDIRAVYYQSRQLIGVDPRSFKVLGEGRAKDTYGTYDLGIREEDGKNAVTDQVNAGKFYIVVAGAVYWQGQYMPVNDVASFKQLSSVYAKDATAAYFQNSRPLDGADPATFEPIQTNIDGLFLAKDARSLYRDYKQLEGMDPASVQILDGAYIKDIDTVYFYDQRVEGADAPSFAALGDGYGTDARGLWSGSTFLKAGPRGSFKLLAAGYATDGVVVYGHGKEIVGSDPATFKVFTTSHYTLDRNGVYYGGKRITTFSSGFQLLGEGYGGYAKTATEVFYDGVKIIGVNAKTFRAIDEEHGTDGIHQYYRGDSIAKTQ